MRNKLCAMQGKQALRPRLPFLAAMFDNVTLGFNILNLEKSTA